MLDFEDPNIKKLHECKTVRIFSTPTGHIIIGNVFIQLMFCISLSLFEIAVLRKINQGTAVFSYT